MDIQKVSFDYLGYYGRLTLYDYHFPKLAIGTNRLYYIHDGSIDITLGNEEKHLVKGHLYLIPNSLPNAMYTRYVDHTCYNFFTFPRIQNSSVIDIPLENEPILEAQIQALVVLVENVLWRDANRGYMKFVASSLYNILFLIDEKSKITCFRDVQMENVIDYIHQHYTSKISIIELAEHFHMEEGTLIRRFKRSTLMTPYRYIKLLRVHYAEELIKEGTGTLEEIAQLVGYADAPTLAHALKNCSRLYTLYTKNARKN